MGINNHCKSEFISEYVSKEPIAGGLSPNVSVIIPAYRVAKYIDEALDSVFTQTYKNYEIIVINDGSPDTEELEEILKPYLNRIIYLKQENQGAGAARNTGIYKARGELIAFLDADDVWLPVFLQSQIAFLEKNKLDMVWADAYLFGEPSVKGRTFMQTSPSTGEVTLESLLDMKCNVITSGTIAKKDEIFAVNGFDQNNIPSEDFDLWVRMAFRGAKLGYQKTVLLMHRYRHDGLSGDPIQKVRKSMDVYNHILKKIKLEENHKIVINNNLSILQSRLRIIQGKIHFVNGDFKSAIENFRTANLICHSFKLKIIISMLHIAPRLSLYIYKLFRQQETNLMCDIDAKIE